MELAIFQKKGNIKRKSKHLLSSEKMMGFAFLASMFVHLVAMYTIPAVDLFSEGPGNAVGEIIEVDFVAEELPDESLEALSQEENRFAAPQPMAVATVPQTDAVVPVEEAEIPALPEIEMPSEGVMLLAQTFESDPEFPLERARPTPEPTLPIRRTAGLTPSEKLPAKQEPVLPDTQNPETPAPQKPPVDPNQVEQEKPMAEDRLQFPTTLPALALRAVDTLPDQPSDQSPGFSGKRAAQPLATDTLPALARAEGVAEHSKRRLVGLDKDSAQDENRFGIFAGEKFELPQIKDAVQEAALTPEEANPLLAAEIEPAKALDTQTQIEGPLRGRAVVYKPALPQLTDVENDVELRLKFWVLPDGTIGEVIPLKRGDAQLERIAIAYLKQWQFEPLRANVPQETIWGTIPIIFTSR